MNGGKRRVLVAYGTRPEAIKLAPVVRALGDSAWLEPVVVVSGQHRSMLDQVNELFGIVPDADLDLASRPGSDAGPARLARSPLGRPRPTPAGVPPPGRSLTELTVHALEGYTAYLSGAGIDAVMVQGDTTTAFAAALAAFYAQLPVVHVEAGLRTGRADSPFPEEANRRLITRLAALHLAPTWRNRQHLLDEGVAPHDVVVTGNTVIDALAGAAALRVPTDDPVVDDAAASGRPILLVTAHRRESWDAGLASIGRAVAAVARARPELLVVVPAHANPIVRDRLLPPLAGLANVRVLEPLSYGPFAHLLSRSAVVLTDSGGIQEEAPTFGVPVLVTRDTTERAEAVDAGVARLVGTQAGAIVHAVMKTLDEPHRVAEAVSPFGDGHAAGRTRAAVEALLGVGHRLPEFDEVAVAAERAS